MPDASVAAKWYLEDEDDTDPALLILSCYNQRECELIAPSCIRYEVPSAIIAATLGRTPRITPERGRQAIQDFLDLELPVADEDTLITAAYELALRHGCAIYDAYYMALAEHLDIPFLTADRRLYDRLHHLPYFIWIGDYPSDISSV